MLQPLSTAARCPKRAQKCAARRAPTPARHMLCHYCIGIRLDGFPVQRAAGPRWTAHTLAGSGLTRRSQAPCARPPSCFGRHSSNSLLPHHWWPAAATYNLAPPPSRLSRLSSLLSTDGRDGASPTATTRPRVADRHPHLRFRRRSRTSLASADRLPSRRVLGVTVTHPTHQGKLRLA